MTRFNISAKQPHSAEAAEIPDGYVEVPAANWDSTPLNSYYKFIKQDGKAMSGFLVARVGELYTFRADLYDTASFTTKIYRRNIKTLYIKQYDEPVVSRVVAAAPIPPLEQHTPAYTPPVEYNIPNLKHLDDQTARDIKMLLSESSRNPEYVTQAELNSLREDVKRMAETLKEILDVINNM